MERNARNLALIRVANALDLGLIGLAAALGTLLLASCASSPPAAPAATGAAGTPSHAMQVLLAAGHVRDPRTSAVRDAPPGALAPAPRDGSRAVTDVGYALSNVLAPPPGIGIGMALGMSALSFWMPDPIDPLAHTMVLAWMPKGLAGSADAASAKLQALVDDALDAALAEALQPPFRAAARAAAQPGRAPVGGGACTDPKRRCAYWVLVSGRAEAGTAPAFLGGGPVWVWRSRTAPKGRVMAAMPGPSIDDLRSGTRAGRDALPDLAVYQAASRRLPAWVFIYLAPGTIALGEGRGFLQIPLVLNAGDPLYFIQPGSTTP